MSGAVVAVVVGLGSVVWWWRRRQRMLMELPHRLAEDVVDEVIDLIAVVLGAGGTIADAVSVVAAVGPPSARWAFVATRRRAAHGSLLGDALVAVSDELGPAYHPLVGALVACERDGTPITALLQRLADEADHTRRHRAALSTGKLPVALLVPLVVCLLPAVVIGALVPLTVVALRHLP